MTNKEKTRKNQYNSYDDDYIEYYVNHPDEGKSAALRHAGYKGAYLSQEANRIHKKLAQRIHDELTVKLKNLEGMAISKLDNILRQPTKDVGYSNMLATLKVALDYAGRKPADQLHITKKETIEDIDSELAKLEQEIAKETRQTIQ